MSTTKTKTSLVDTVLALHEASLNFRVELSPKQAEEWAGKFEPFNGLGTGDLPRLVKRINKLVPPMQFGEGNPNNGLPHHHFEVGNECSLVVYLVVRGAYLKGGVNEAVLLAGQVEAFAKTANADERSVEVEEDAGFRVRMWWD